MTQEKAHRLHDLYLACASSALLRGDVDTARAHATMAQRYAPLDAVDLLELPDDEQGPEEPSAAWLAHVEAIEPPEEPEEPERIGSLEIRGRTVSA